MFLNRTASRILLALAGFSAGCRQMPPSAATQQVAARAVPASTGVQHASPQRETSPSDTSQAGQAARVTVEQPKVEDVEERKGPFTIGGADIHGCSALEAHGTGRRRGRHHR